MARRIPYAERKQQVVDLLTEWDEPATVLEIAEAIDMRGSQIYGLLDRMEADDLIESFPVNKQSKKWQVRKAVSGNGVAAPAPVKTVSLRRQLDQEAKIARAAEMLFGDLRRVPVFGLIRWIETTKEVMNGE